MLIDSQFSAASVLDYIITIALVSQSQNRGQTISLLASTNQPFHLMAITPVCGINNGGTELGLLGLNVPCLLLKVTEVLLEMCGDTLSE